MKSAILAALALTIAGGGLASCKDGGAQPSQSAPEAPAGISAADGRLVLPAVKGNPGAVYFDITNNGDKDTAIAGAFVDGAKSAMLHTSVMSGGMSSMQDMDQIPLAKGATVSFAPGGNHVMAINLDPALTAGGTTEVTVTLASGDKVSFQAKVLAAGDAR
ncbi:MAG: copper chaperone PCu(A)C [Candidatus Andeanibacterium colombiense]|uniref:Copper chaperone PCu(A)C n=1 Tax=Candidatus Andeanibacterium colombiense TaxID=3121345 RepID=A0AAJ5X6V1_9SPHN|nr:MAG: copper chaperone PCu(A)C [Sphingomonadaceae bacterium]